MTNSESGESMASVSFSASLKHILLVKVRAERKPLTAQTLETRPSTNIKTTIRCATEGVEAFFDVSMAFPNPEEPFCTLKYTMRAVFEIEPPPTSDAVHQRAVTALVTSLAWPYLREYARSVFDEMQILGPVPFPFTISPEAVLEKLDMAPTSQSDKGDDAAAELESLAKVG